MDEFGSKDDLKPALFVEWKEINNSKNILRMYWSIYIYPKYVVDLVLKKKCSRSFKKKYSKRY